jgi:hypothetical protein
MTASALLGSKPGAKRVRIKMPEILEKHNSRDYLQSTIVAGIFGNKKKCNRDCKVPQKTKQFQKASGW